MFGSVNIFGDADYGHLKIMFFMPFIDLFSVASVEVPNYFEVNNFRYRTVLVYGSCQLSMAQWVIILNEVSYKRYVSH